MPYMEEILEKMRKYCVFQDRSALEVKLKLNPYRLTQTQMDDLIESLKKDNFINEERFIRNFIRGKMNARQWGKMKIKNELLRKGINEQMITAYMEEIEEDPYLENLYSSIEKWLRSNQLNRETYPKLYRHLLGKGFENEIIITGIKNYPNK
jgi:regulatory protein